jgi:hypothetical protein
MGKAMTTPVYTVTRLNITVVKTKPPGLAISVEGEVGTPGWTGFALDHRIYIAPPADGIYEADMVGVPPGGNVIQVVTPFCYDETWAPFPADLKGLKVYSATNAVTVALE